MATTVLATAGPTALWYLTRATGIVSLVLLTGTVILGVLTTRGWSSDRWPRFTSQAMHRNLSLFCILLIGIHIVTTVTDGFAPIGYLDSILPFHSPYRSLWLGLGALSFDLLVVVALTSAVRHRLGYRTWRAVHWLAYASWPVAVLHGLGTGTDTTLSPVLLLDAICVAAVLVVVGWRLAAGWPAQAGTRVAAGTAAGAFAVSAAAFVAAGPLRAGWAQRAGTPAALLTAAKGPGAQAQSASAPPAPSAARAPATTAPSESSGAPTGPFTGSLSGTLTSSSPDASGHVTVEIQGRLSGDLSLPFDIKLVGTPEGDGVAMKSGRVTVGSVGGPVVGLEGDRIVGDIGSGADALQVTFRVSIERSAVLGTVRAVAAGGDR